MSSDGIYNGSPFKQDSSRVVLKDYELDSGNRDPVAWVNENTAIMVVHGIGHQKPNETLDLFSRGLIEKYQALCREKLRVSHKIETIERDGSVGFQNVIRVQNPESEFHIDIYEYYWAYCTEDKATMSDINSWLHGVVQGAKKFYQRNAHLGKKYEDSSPFFKNGEFIAWKYDLFLNFFAKSYMLINGIVSLLLKLLALVPFVGALAEKALQSYMQKGIYRLTNLLGDIAIYNVLDEKSKFYSVRVQILEGATRSLKNLIEKKEGDRLAYTSILLAGHSLGSQIAYDTMNRINLLANLGQLRNYDTNGFFVPGDTIDGSHTIIKLSDQIKGFITFGSPLDKIVFFLRQHIADHQYLWQQITDNYHCFKQRQWNNLTYSPEQTISSGIKRLLDDIPWFNYYDGDDIISGGLDYFINVVNVDCKINTVGQFKSNRKERFTHSHYWHCRNFYEDIIRNMLSVKKEESILPGKMIIAQN
jgi:hypothetical protein